MAMTQDAAEIIAIKVLGWLGQNDDLFGIFAGSTGVSAQEAAERATDPEFLASVMDFLLMDDRWITGFCDDADLSYDSPMQVRAALPGGQHMNWT